MSRDPVGPYERRVIGAVGDRPRTPLEIATQLGDPLAAVQRALVRIVEAGLAESDGGRVWLTRAGRAVATRPQAASRAQPDPAETVQEILRVVSSLGSSWLARAATTSTGRSTAADAVRASDADRDGVVQRLATAYTEGRLTTAELEERTGRALTARTHGDLDRVLDGLGGLARPAGRHPLRTAVFWLATVLLSPFVLVSTLFVLFGSDLGDHVFGLVLLALTGLPLLSLWRWSRKRDGRTVT